VSDVPGTDSLAVLTGRLLAAHQVPRVGLVRQLFEAPVESYPDAAAGREAAAVLRGAGRAPGPVAVGVGSRGVANLEGLVRGTVRALRAAGWEPFIVPAMGSHGAATADGQAEVLAGYGIDRSLVRATMETEILGEVLGVPVHVDREAVAAGAVFLVNRVKPHTSFRGPVESGLAKMCAIGLGKQAGAKHMHSRGVAGLAELIPAGARLVADSGLLVGGLGIVENQRDQTALVRGLTAAEVAAQPETDLLQEARRLMPRIPFEDLDVLVIDRMGKDVSGAGLDTNVLRRLRVVGQPEQQPPAVSLVVVLDLTEQSHGNAMGIGSADFTTTRLLRKIDFEALYANAITAGLIGVQRMAIPAVMANDLAAVTAAIAARGRDTPLRLAWIADTLHTETLAVSEALLREAGSRQDLEVLGEPRPMPFDAEGALRPLS